MKKLLFSSLLAFILTFIIYLARDESIEVLSLFFLVSIIIARININKWIRMLPKTIFYWFRK